MILNIEKTFTEKLADSIIEYIITNNLQPGDKLPNEQILSSTLNAGRSSVREAVKLLVSRNIVEVKQGSGTYVSDKKGIADDPIGLTFIQDKKKLTFDLMEIRFLLEPYIASLAALNADEKDIEKITKLCNEIETAIRAGEQYKELDIAFHTAIAESTKNCIVPRLIPIINSTIGLFIDLVCPSLAEETISSHREIAEAIAERNPITAKDAMYLHLVYNRKRIKSLFLETN